MAQKYVHQEYPRHVHKAGGEHLEVKNEDECDAAIKDGWSLKPVAEEVKPEVKAEVSPAPKSKIFGKKGE